MPPDEATLNAARAALVGVDSHREGWQAEVLDRMKAQWEETGMPLAPWHAFRWAREYAIPVPEWVMDHFYAISDKLLKIGRIGGGDLREDQAVGRALGFGGGGKGEPDFSANWLVQDRDFKIAVRMVLEYELRGSWSGKKKVLEEMIGKDFLVSRQTVRNAYKEHHEAARAYVSQMLVSLTPKV